MVPEIFESEYRFCLILWDCEPIKSADLARLCKEKLGWSRTTTYTVIKRLSDRGVVRNDNSMVTSIISKEDAEEAQIDELIKKKFNNSLPEFITAFSKRQKLTQDQIDRINSIIDKGGE